MCKKCNGKGWYQFNGDDINLLTLCEICKQKGFFNDIYLDFCEYCGGLGEVLVINRYGIIQQKTLEKCKHCDGKGLVDKEGLNILW